MSATADGDGTATMSVTDTGIGIAPADQDRLFHEFGQVPNPLQAKVRGTGLGLSLSKRLAELLGGSVGVTSALGEGSTFWLRMPMTAPGFEPPIFVVAPAAAQSRDVPLALVIDDEQTARYLLRRYLTAIGCRVSEASGGPEGLARAESERPDVIFLDLRMPEMLGTEVLARLKRNPATSGFPLSSRRRRSLPPTSGSGCQRMRRRSWARAAWDPTVARKKSAALYGRQI